MLRAQILILDGVFDLGLSALVDTLTTANELAGDAPPFALERVALRRSVRTQRGLTVPTEPIGRATPDLILVPALGCKTPDTLVAALERRDVAEAGAFLRESAARGVRISAACTATFVLASSGLLDGRSATTTWWLAPLFRERFPAVELDESRMIVEAGRIATAGAALAHLDLALWLVRRKSPSLAATTARYLIFDQRTTQASYAILDHLAHADPLVERFEKWARRTLKERFSLAAAARAVGTSERTLARRLQAVLGRSPLAYVHDLRVERAVHLLQTTDASVDEIADAVGYGNAVTLRALLRKKTGRGVRELRVRRPPLSR
jgi:transcriptional regulator GlxA family with amidase domain